MDKIVVCYHEAGHAIGACLNGIEVNEVAVERGQAGWKGMTACEPTDSAESEIKMLLSGPEAEDLAKSKHPDMDQGTDTDIVARAEKDRQMVTPMLCELVFGVPDTFLLTPEQLDQLEEELEQRQAEARTALGAKWQKLQAVAEVLFNEDLVSKDRLSDILGLPSEDD
jgi:ATP-dependent Zn protease